ncbi:hypothetical protein JCM10207_006887 [Rhodosporidiobolus poonsookiae]
MASPELCDCTVCTNKTNKRCSACTDPSKPVLFCSESCFRLAWPVHRQFCKTGGAFVHPPLDEDEVDTLKQLENVFLMERRTMIGEPMLKRVQRWALYEGDYKTLRTELPSRPPMQHPRADTHPRARHPKLPPRRRHPPPGVDLTIPVTFWQHSLSALIPFLNEARSPIHAPTPDPTILVRAQEYFKQ